MDNRFITSASIVSNIQGKMNNFIDIKNKRITIIGLRESGFRSAKLANYLGGKIFGSDISESLEVSNNAMRLMTENHIPTETGKHTKKIFETDFWIISPGIPKTSKIILEAKTKGIPIYSELEFASWYTKSPIIAITGSNGKTTTSLLLLEIIKKKYSNSVVAGNIGIPFSKLVLEELINPVENRFFILEVSSFQLEFIQSFKPIVSIYTNISHDHLDRHKTMDEYISMKLRMIENMDESGFIIYKSKDKILKKKFKNSNLNTIPVDAFSSQNQYYVKDSYLYKSGEKILKMENFNLIGKHNYLNLVSAITCSSLFDIPIEEIKKAICDFNFIEHRQELVLVKDNISYINDSKATNIDSVICAIKTYKKPTLILIGGYNKNSKFQLLLPHIKASAIKFIICFGDAGKLIKTALGDAVRSFLCKDLNSAVMKASKLAISGDIILLSPGCASFDEFKNYEDRGNYFKKLIKSLAEND